MSFGLAALVAWTVFEFRQFACLLDALDGGHLLLGHQTRVGAEIDAFFGAALRR